MTEDKIENNTIFSKFTQYGQRVTRNVGTITKPDGETINYDSVKVTDTQMAEAGKPNKVKITLETMGLLEEAFNKKVE